MFTFRMLPLLGCVLIASAGWAESPSVALLHQLDEGFAQVFEKTAPSVVVLDRTGREAWRHVGFVSLAALEAAVRAVEAASPPPRELPP